MPWSYPVIIGIAIATGLTLSRKTQRGVPLEDGQRIGIGVGAFVGAMLGAKLPFALSDWRGFLEGGAWFTDGKTILTGLVGGYFGVVVAKWSLLIRVRTGDSFAMPVAASVAIGRLGCFVAGCCYGRPTTLPWGVVFAQHGPLPRHPTQLYEAAFHSLAALALYRLQRCGLFRGNLMKLYIIAYALYRFLTEFLREEQPLWFDLTGYQWASLVLVVLFGWIWWREADKPAIRSATVSID
ncbi:MAG TPA: prolipoprotein diacylglyceryl transferase family protein [Pirellulales bacterium]|jgi:phosphatidylglycerol:prolipoprotein diacylglycerol transferase|nr:prolipoprotein diacylglyceryl transferase family protein [Pirellulales bacterium]